MKNLRKQWMQTAAIWLSMVLLAGFCCSFHTVQVCAKEAEDASQFLPPKKVVSIVYDDSTSMRAFGGNLLDNWATANYAMQSLTALLSTRDELYITRMSDYKHSVEVNLANKSSAIQKIRNQVEWADGTYLEAVAVAMKRLKEQAKQETDENTQYWLVIVTDGSMETYQGKDLQTLLNEYKGHTFPNGSQLYIKYMGIGTQAVTIEEDVENGLQSCPAGNDIVKTLNDIAKNVSGCFEFGEESSSSIEILDKRTVHLYSAIPLYNISIFSQNSNASVESAVLNEDHKMNVLESIYMEVTDPENAGNNRNTFADANTKNLKGYEFKINLNQELIPAGDYTITFSQDISEDNFVAMYQPAIGLNLTVTENGEEIVPENLRQGDELEVKLEAVNPINGETIPVENLPEDVTWEMSCFLDGEETDSVQFHRNDELKWNISDICAGNMTIKGTMYIPDYAPTNTYEHLEVLEPRAVTIEPVQITNGGDAVYERAALGIKGSETPLVFQLLDHGEVMSREELLDEGIDGEDFSLQIDVEGTQEGFLNRFLYGGWKESKTSMTIQEDGSIVVYPDSIVNFAPFMIKTGNYQVKLSIDSRENCTGTGTYHINGKWSDWIYVIWILLFIAITVYIIWVITKVRFRNQTVVQSVWEVSGTRGGGKRVGREHRTKLSPVCLSLFDPVRRDVVQSAFGLTFIAMPGGNVKISAESFAKYEGFRKPGGRTSLEDSFAVVANPNNFRKYDKKNKMRNRDINIGTNGIYLKQGRRIIWISIEKENRKKSSRRTGRSRSTASGRSSTTGRKRSSFRK